MHAPRRRMRARAERAARIDHDARRPPPAALPRRADPEAARASGRWKARQRPPSPARRRLAVARRRTPRGRAPRPPRRRRRRARRQPPPSTSSNPAGASGRACAPARPPRAPRGRARRRARSRQRNALFSRSKKPSSSGSRTPRRRAPLAKLLEQRAAARRSAASGSATSTRTQRSPRREPAQRRHALAAQHADLARLRARRRPRARRRRRASARAPSCRARPRSSSAGRRVQVVAVADEPRVGPNADDDVRVAGARRRAKPAWPSPAHPDPLAVVDPGGHVDVELRARRRRGPRRAVVARASRRLAGAVAVAGTLRCWTNWPKTFWDTRRTRPAPPHVEHVRGAGARLGAVAAAPLAGHGDLDAARRPSRPRTPPRASISTTVCDVAAARRRRARPRPAEQVLAEERGEDVREVPEVGELGWKPPAPQARRGRSGRTSRGAPGRRAPRTPPRPRGTAARRPARSETSGWSSRARRAERPLDLGVASRSRGRRGARSSHAPSSPSR